MAQEMSFRTTFTVDQTSSFEANFTSRGSTTFSTDFVMNEVPPYYDGEYEVIPKRTEQTLYTTNKTMSHDVTIKEIPYSETSNMAGGQTFYIAKEIE